jgi:hypothetical protein
MVQEHAELLRAYRLVNNVDKACYKCILKAFHDEFMSSRADPIICNVKETSISLLTHLKDCYAFISPIELIDSYESMIQPYDPSCPIEDLFKHMQYGRASAHSGDQPFGYHQIINIAYALIFNSGVYMDGCKNGRKMIYWTRLGIISKRISPWSTCCITSRVAQHMQVTPTPPTMPREVYKPTWGLHIPKLSPFLPQQQCRNAELCQLSSQPTPHSHLIWLKKHYYYWQKTKPSACSEQKTAHVEERLAPPTSPQLPAEEVDAYTLSRTMTTTTGSMISKFHGSHKSHVHQMCTIHAERHQELTTKTTIMEGLHRDHDAARCTGAA